MYVAKRKRSSLSIYRPEQDFNNMRHLLLRGDLRMAIEGGDLKLAYQPKINAVNDRYSSSFFLSGDGDGDERAVK